jgi:hypothetical protein
VVGCTKSRSIDWYKVESCSFPTSGVKDFSIFRKFLLWHLLPSQGLSKVLQVLKRSSQEGLSPLIIISESTSTDWQSLKVIHTSTFHKVTESLQRYVAPLRYHSWKFFFLSYIELLMLYRMKHNSMLYPSQKDQDWRLTLKKWLKIRKVSPLITLFPTDRSHVFLRWSFFPCLVLLPEYIKRLRSRLWRRIFSRIFPIIFEFHNDKISFCGFGVQKERCSKGVFWYSTLIAVVSFNASKPRRHVTIWSEVKISNFS